MEKKTIFLELPCELVEKIDNINTMGDRSAFVSDLLNKQIDANVQALKPATELTAMSGLDKPRLAGEIGLIDRSGVSLGSFDINNVDGFEQLAKKIEEVSDDPVVKIRARRWL